MPERPRRNPGLTFQGVLLIAAVVCSAASTLRAGECPTSSDEIATDRPDVTNSSLVVPSGSLQAENGLDWTSAHGRSALDGSNTRLRAGVAHCTEAVLDVPSYFYPLSRGAASGFSDLTVSFKRQLEHLPAGFEMSATAGLAFPIGARRVSAGGYAPYVQFPWSRAISGNWSVEGMFTLTWFTGQAMNNATFEPTFAIERAFGPSADVFVEYVGDYPHHAQANQLLDGGGAWRITARQQLDFHLGLGLNSNSVGHFFGIGYSFRLDGIFGVNATGPP